MFEHFLLPLLFLTGLIGGTVDAIAGGGGLISLPVLLGLGLPPQIALGTNKLQTSFGTFLATHSYYKQGWFSLKQVYKTIIIISCGTICGVMFSQTIRSEVLQKIIPIFLLLILLYFIFSPKPSQTTVSTQTKMDSILFSLLFGLLLGFYDGFLSPGVGAFWMFALIFFLGYNLTTATAHTKIFNLTSNIVATACFAYANCIDYRIALSMALGQIIGGKLGAYLAIKKGVMLIHPIFITIVFSTLMVLIYRNYLPSTGFNLFFISALITAIVAFLILNVRYFRKINNIE